MTEAQVLELANDLLYSRAVKIFEWNGYDVYEGRNKKGSFFSMPMMFLSNETSARYATLDEMMDIRHARCEAREQMKRRTKLAKRTK